MGMLFFSGVCLIKGDCRALAEVCALLSVLLVFLLVYECINVSTVFTGSGCNSTVTLDDSRPVVYIRLPGGYGESRATSGLSAAAQPRGAPSASGPQRAFSASCPTMFRTRSGQRIAVTLYSFRTGGHVVPVPEVVVPAPEVVVPISEVVVPVPEVVRPGGGGGSTEVAGACDVGPVTVVESGGRRRVHGLCDPRQHREQLLLTTNTSHVAVFFDEPDQRRPTRPPQRPPTSSSRPLSTNYIIKLEGILVFTSSSGGGHNNHSTSTRRPFDVE